MKNKKRISRNGDDYQSKPFWRFILESSGGTTIITVLIGGLLGQWINFTIQKGLKDREFQQEMMKNQHSQDLLAYKEYQSQEKSFIQNIYEITGESIFSASELININEESYNPKIYSGKDRKKIEDQRFSIRENYNKSIAKLARESLKLRFLIGYYHAGDHKLSSTWNELEKSLEDYMECAGSYYMDHSFNKKYLKNCQEACKDKEKKVKDLLNNFTHQLESTRKFD